MEKKEIRKLLLTLPEPLAVDTEEAGRILLSHWTVGAIIKMAEVLEEPPVDSSDFVRRFVAALGRTPGAGEKLSEQYEAGSSIRETDRLTDADIRNIAHEYMHKFKNDILYWVAYTEEETLGEEIEKKADEPDEEFFFRIIRLSVEKSEEQSRRLYDKFKFPGASKGLLEKLSQNQVKIGALGARIREINSASILPPILPELSPELLRNPVVETNGLLEAQGKQLGGIAELLETQSEQAVLLNEQTALLLRESATSSSQTKNGMRIAAFGIVISALLSAYSIYRTVQSEIVAGAVLRELLESNALNWKAQTDFTRQMVTLTEELADSQGENKEMRDRMMREILVLNGRTKEVEERYSAILKALSEKGTNKALNKDAAR